MAPISVHVKHSGKVHDVELDTDLPPNAFKEAIYEKTGIPVDRMKVMIKGGMLKDDTPWAKVAPKPNQTFMVIGTAGELPKPPEKPVVFLEDLEDEELANALVKPVGLKNLGNTCYMNSTVQALRAIPELELALKNSGPAASTSAATLPTALKSLYDQMGRTTDTVTPSTFLDALRQANPQFGEMDRREGMGMRGYAQQDAEECYSQILNSLRDVPVPRGESAQGSSSSSAASKFIEQYMVAKVRRELKNSEAAEEPPTVSEEKVMKIECNININTNYMATGISNSMETTVEKHSNTLNRTALYTQTSKITRLPAYLTVHMVRFAWRQDVQKKAKIMRKVKFPTEYDALDLTSDELKEKLLPVSRRLKGIEKERGERKKVRARTKVAAPKPDEAGSSTTPVATASADGESSAPVDASQGGELLPEIEYRKKERAELDELTPQSLKDDTGSSWSGLYDLVAIITHKGAAADSGHYIGFVKKSVFHGTSPREGGAALFRTLGLTSGTGAAVGVSSDGDVQMGDDTGSNQAPQSLAELMNPNLNGQLVDDDEDWYKFDDDKVSIFPKAKLATLDGGGEDSSAYVLLYRTKSF